MKHDVFGAVLCGGLGLFALIGGAIWFPPAMVFAIPNFFFALCHWSSQVEEVGW